jgi:hypothetical protein
MLVASHVYMMNVMDGYLWYTLFVPSTLCSGKLFYDSLLAALLNLSL